MSYLNWHTLVVAGLEIVRVKVSIIIKINVYLKGKCQEGRAETPKHIQV